MAIQSPQSWTCMLSPLRAREGEHFYRGKKEVGRAISYKDSLTFHDWVLVRKRWLSSSCSVSSVQLLSHVWLFVTPWTAAHQASLSFTNSQSLLKLMSIESVMPSNHLILCCPLLLLPSIFPRFRVFSNESALHIR